MHGSDSQLCARCSHTRLSLTNCSSQVRCLLTPITKILASGVPSSLTNCSMLMNTIKNLQSLDLADKRVLVRVDFNVPLDAEGTVMDDTRIVAALPTLRTLLEQKCRVILLSHLGRPKGGREEKYSLRPVAADLSQKIGQPVLFVEDCLGPAVEEAVEHLAPGSVLLLENVRFHAGETKNDPELAAKFAQLADVYINDAFGSAHRAHASTTGVAGLMPAKGAGLLMEQELSFLGKSLKKKLNKPLFLSIKILYFSFTAKI